jgi:hypothetical protein
MGRENPGTGACLRSEPQDPNIWPLFGCLPFVDRSGQGATRKRVNLGREAGKANKPLGASGLSR